MLGKLNYTEAIERSKLVSNVRSEYTITFSETGKLFSCDAKIAFHYTPNAEGTLDHLFMETCANAIRSASINGSDLSSADISTAHDAEKKRFYIRLSEPRAEQDVTVAVSYECSFVQGSGSGGIHRVVTSPIPKEEEDTEEEEEVVIWCSFEPFSAHTAFICFNQPNIKSTFKLSVVAPASYTAYSNCDEVHIDAVDGSMMRHEFEDMRVPIPPYLYNVVVGDLAQVGYRNYTRVHPREGDGRESDKEVLLSVIVPKSYEDYTDSDNILDAVTAALEYYERTFDEPYYFDKYDSVFVPGFNFGAMENPGLVTYTDAYIYRDRVPTTVDLARRSETIVHEAMHMWLGDAVTPAWWDCLWLSEGFASYFGYEAKRVLPDPAMARERWLDFHNVKRAQCVAFDKASVHPVQNTVCGKDSEGKEEDAGTGTWDTDIALQIFDPISYGKGGAVVKQLVATIGEERFVAAVREYIKRFKMGNPTYEDFKSVFTKYVPEAWLDAWLRSTGLTTLVPTLTLTLTDGEQQQQQQQQQPRVASFTVRQLPPSGSKAATLLPHHVEVGLFDFGPAGLTLRKAVPIDIRPVADEQDFTEAVFGSGDDDSSDRAHPPALVYINYRELTLANCAIDTRSLAFAGLHLDDIVFGAGSAKGKGKDGEEKEDDPDMLLLGMQILESLTFMLKDFRLRPEAFTACVLTVAMEAVRAHPKVRVAIDKAEAAMLSLPKIIPQESPVLAALGKYCAAKFLTGSKAGSEMGEIALRIAERCPKTAEFILTLLLSDGIPRSTAAFWYSVSSLVAWKAIPSLEKLQALAARFYRVAGVDEKEGLRKCTEDVWRASSGNIDDAVALWEECFAKDPEDLFSEASYSGLFMTPNRNCLLELVERKKDEITNPIAVVRLINARETDAEFVDAISKLPICESESIQRYVKRAQAISKGILLTMARYSKVEQPKMK